MSYAHKGQILPIQNQMIPINKDTTFHASYDYDLNGMNQGEVVSPIGPSTALSLNGINDFIEISNPTELAMTDNFTINAWIKPRSISGGIFVKGQIGGWASNEYGIRSISGVFRFYVSDKDNTNLNFIIFTPPLNQWTFISAVADKSSQQLRVYMNGQLTATGSYTVEMIDKNRDAYIGKGFETTFYDGEVSDLSIHKEAMSEASIQYAMTNGVSHMKNSLIAHYKLNEKEGPIAYDSSPCQNDGIWVGNLAPVYGPTIASLAEGKFKSGVLIEEGTSNQVSYSANFSIPVGSSLVVNNRRVTRLEEHTFRVDWEADITGTQVFSMATSIAWGNPGVISAEVLAYYEAPGTTHRFGLGRSNFGGAHIHGYDGLGWKSHVYTGDNGSSTLCIRTNSTEAIVRSGSYIVFRNAQAEVKPFATSFVSGSRPTGVLAYPSNILNTNTFTFSSWVKTTAKTSSPQPIFELSISSSQRLLLSHQSSSHRLGLWSTGQMDILSTFVPPINEWYMVTLTYNGTIYRLYCNGVEVAIGTRSPYQVTSETFYFGGRNAGVLNGILDEVRIERRAISPEEVAAWYAAGIHYNYLDYSLHVD